MSRTLASMVAGLIVLVTVPQLGFGATWSIGSHLGLGRLKGLKGGGASTVLAWPSNALGYQPALRIGFGDSRRAHELQLDSGVFLVDEGGSTFSAFSGSAGYQFTVFSSWTNAPFANLGLGFFREGGAAHSTLSTSWGAGIGMRHLVHDRHGALRFEGRVDHLQSAEKIGRPGITTVGVRLGFDLWL